VLSPDLRLGAIGRLPKAGEFEPIELSHHDDRCSFETILEKHEIDDPVMWEIGRIIHEADIGDEVYEAPEARGS
jgi:hypothetical protein